MINKKEETSFTESVIIPKTVFLKHVKCLEAKEQNKDEGILSNKNISPSRRLQIYHQEKLLGKDEERMEVEKVKPDSKISDYFDPKFQIHINYTLAVLKKHKNIIDWDPKNYEIIVRGEQLAQTNLIDILSYLQKTVPSSVIRNTRSTKKKDRTATTDNLKDGARYITGEDYDHIFPQAINIPRGTLKFKQALEEIFGRDNIRSYFPKFQEDRLKLLDEFEEEMQITKIAETEKQEDLEEKKEESMKKYDTLRENFIQRKENLSKRLAEAGDIKREKKI